MLPRKAYSVFFIAIIIIIFILALIVYNKYNNTLNTHKPIEIWLYSGATGTQVAYLYGYYSKPLDPYDPTKIVLGYDGTKFGNASGIWILRGIPIVNKTRNSIKNATVELIISGVPRFSSANFNYIHNASYLIVINNRTITKGSLDYRYGNYGFIPRNTSNVKVFLSSNKMIVLLNWSEIQQSEAEVKLMVSNGAIWEINMINITMIYLTYNDITKINYLMIIIIIATIFNFILLMHIIYYYIINFIHIPLIILLIIIFSLLLKFYLAPFTQDEWDLPYFQNFVLATYLLGINPIPLWGYGPGGLLYILFAAAPALLFSNIVDINISILLRVFLKIYLILIDGLIFLELNKYSNSIGMTKRSLQLLAIIWFLNPYNILLSGVWGQLDILATFFMVLATFHLILEKPKTAGLMLFISFLIKYYTISYIALLIIYYIISKKYNFILNMIKGSIAPLLISIPYFIYLIYSNPSMLAYRIFSTNWSLYYQGLTIYVFFWRFNSILSFISFTNVYIILLLIISFVFILKKDIIFTDDKKIYFKIATISIILLYLSYNIVNQQYFYWILPFLIILSIDYLIYPWYLFGIELTIINIMTYKYLFNINFTIFNHPFFDTSVSFLFFFTNLISIFCILYEKYPIINKDDIIIFYILFALMLAPIFSINLSYLILISIMLLIYIHFRLKYKFVIDKFMKFYVNRTRQFMKTFVAFLIFIILFLSLYIVLNVNLSYIVYNYRFNSLEYIIFIFGILIYFLYFNIYSIIKPSYLIYLYLSYMSILYYLVIILYNFFTFHGYFVPPFLNLYILLLVLLFLVSLLSFYMALYFRTNDN
jgi:hypothetical protein